MVQYVHICCVFAASLFYIFIFYFALDQKDIYKLYLHYRCTDKMSVMLKPLRPKWKINMTRKVIGQMWLGHLNFFKIFINFWYQQVFPSLLVSNFDIFIGASFILWPQCWVCYCCLEVWCGTRIKASLKCCDFSLICIFITFYQW